MWCLNPGEAMLIEHFLNDYLLVTLRVEIAKGNEGDSDLQPCALSGRSFMTWVKPTWIVSRHIRSVH